MDLRADTTTMTAKSDDCGKETEMLRKLRNCLQTELLEATPTSRKEAMCWVYDSMSARTVKHDIRSKFTHRLLDELAACLDGMSAMEWPGSTILSIISKKTNSTSIIAKVAIMIITIADVHGVGTATLKQQSSEQWKTSHSSGSLLLLPIVILFLISCWINSVPLHPRPVPYFDPHPQHLLST